MQGVVIVGENYRYGKKKIMKKRTIILFCMAFILLLFYSIAFSGERPKDFRGIVWGTRISELSGFILKPLPENSPYIELIKKEREEQERKGIKTYIRPSDSLRIGNIRVDTIEYEFYNDCLSKIRIGFNSYEQYFSLKSLFFDLFGTPDKEKTRRGPIEGYSLIDHDWYASRDDEANVNLVWQETSWAKGGTAIMEWKKALKEASGL